MMLLIFLATLVIALLAQWHVKRVYARHSRTPTASGYTGAAVAEQILRQSGITNVEIVEHEELLGDHYDQRHKRLVLSRANYRGTSAAALGVAAHECGHAIQHKMAYAPLQIRRTGTGCGEPSVERCGLDLCGSLHFITGLFPLARAAFFNRTTRRLMRKHQHIDWPYGASRFPSSQHRNQLSEFHEHSIPYSRSQRQL